KALLARLGDAGRMFLRPVEIVRSYRRSDLRPDVVAGLTVAVVVVPQAIAYAFIAELPPEVGLYTAIVGAIVGALWGSSNQLQTGPTNATSLLVLSVLLGVASPGQPGYVAAAGVMALIVGVARLGMGLARLGVLVNFVSDSVIVGFLAGGGVLIFANQLRHLLRLSIPSAPGLIETLPSVASRLAETHWPSLAIGLGTLGVMLLMRRFAPRLPGPLIAISLGGLVVGLGGLDEQGVRVVGQLPRGLPPLADLSVLNLKMIGQLAAGSLAVAAIGLVEAISIARSIASQTGQRLDPNQELVGQGLANLACGLFSGYTCGGSLARSQINYMAGAQTSLSNVFASVFVLFAVLLLGPLAAYIPLSGLAGVLVLTAYMLINQREIARIWRVGGGDRIIMVATIVATLALRLELAVLVGIALSVGHYLLKTSTPRVRTVHMSDDFRYFTPSPGKPSCPELGVLEIMGDLYFGAANHIEGSIRANLAANPTQRFLLLRMYTVEHCDISGIHALESIVRAYRQRMGDVFFVHVQRPVLELMKSSGFYDTIGADHFLEPDSAISYLFQHVIDPAICIYECPVRAFLECQNLPKRLTVGDLRWDAALPAALPVPSVAPRDLWAELRGAEPPEVIDVREPREFQR
ncbi:MAG: sulfate permease, partial [Anaerolineales bacterium]|nr:sulfate permease [Anaerolineales bacterium]